MLVEFIEKQAILEFLKERLESRKSGGRFKLIEVELTNNAKIELLEDLIGNIERGMFDKQKVEYKELTEDEYDVFDRLRIALYNDKSMDIWPNNISKMKKFISQMNNKYKGNISAKVTKYFSEVESLMRSYERILEDHLEQKER